MAKSSKKGTTTKKRRNNGNGSVGGGIKGSGIAAATGIAAYFAHSMIGNNVAVMKTYWWLAPITMGVGGHLLKRSRAMQAPGIALLGAAGYSMGLGYALKKAADAAETAETTTTSETAALIDPRRMVGRRPPRPQMHAPTPAPMQQEVPTTEAETDETGAMYDTGVAGYLSDATNPTSRYYMGPQNDSADEDYDVSEAANL